MVQNEKTALLVVDMQVGVISQAHERENVINNIKKLVQQAREKKSLVIWVQHSSEHELQLNSESWQIVPEFDVLASESRIYKKYGDSFEDTELESILKSHNINKLIVTGAQTEACIRSTIHGAFVRGYNTTLVSDAHTTEDLTAYGLPAPDKIIDFTNTYWKFQSAPNRKAEVIETAKVQF